MKIHKKKKILYADKKYFGIEISWKFWREEDYVRRKSGNMNLYENKNILCRNFQLTLLVNFGKHIRPVLYNCALFLTLSLCFSAFIFLTLFLRFLRLFIHIFHSPSLFLFLHLYSFPYTPFSLVISLSINIPFSLPLSVCLSPFSNSSPSPSQSIPSLVEGAFGAVWPCKRAHAGERRNGNGCRANLIVEDLSYVNNI